MRRHWSQIFLFVFFALSPVDGFSSSSVEELYAQELKESYTELAPLKKEAEKRKRTYIISAILAVGTLLLFTYFYKLTGLIVSLIMIAAGIWVLKSNAPTKGSYEERFKKEIISPLIGLSYHDSAFTQEEIEESHLFAPSFKSYEAWDRYEDHNASLSYVRIVFDTKENASVERFAENIFEGFILKLPYHDSSNGVGVSHALRDKVAKGDIPFSSFFAKGTREVEAHGFDFYGSIKREDKERLFDLNDLPIAVSFRPNGIYIALLMRPNPLVVDSFKEFDLLAAKAYAKSMQIVHRLIADF